MERRENHQDDKQYRGSENFRSHQGRQRNHEQNREQNRDEHGRFQSNQNRYRTQGEDYYDDRDAHTSQYDSYEDERSYSGPRQGQFNETEGERFYNSPYRRGRYDEDEDFGSFRQDRNNVGSQSGYRNQSERGSSPESWMGDTYSRGFAQGSGPASRLASGQFGSRSDRNAFDAQQEGQKSRSRSAQGQFTGVGPKNYSRSKDRIIEDVNQELTEHSELDATEIEVDFESGEVILRGKVENREAKRLAEEIAEQVSGVKDVRNELKVSSASHKNGRNASQHDTESGKSKSNQGANDSARRM